MARESVPHISELIEHCDSCGEELDHGREECVTLDCPRYLEITNSIAAEGVLAHQRDVRECRDQAAMIAELRAAERGGVS